MSKCGVIVTGGEIVDEHAVRMIEEMDNPIIIGADRGVAFLYRNQIMPSYIVGDFDSLPREIVDYYRNETKVPIREFNPVKDASDTEIAIRMGVAVGCDYLMILGATGGRIDHLWANIQTLMIPFEAGVAAYIVDQQNRIRLIGGETHLRKERAYGKYFSVFPLGGDVPEFSIEGAKYPLKNYTLSSQNSRCVSNEIAEEEAVIRFPKGIVVLMETGDKE